MIHGGSGASPAESLEKISNFSEKCCQVFMNFEHRLHSQWYCNDISQRNISFSCNLLEILKKREIIIDFVIFLWKIKEI